MSFAKNIRHILKSQLQAISNAFIVYFVLSGHDKKTDRIQMHPILSVLVMGLYA